MIHHGNGVTPITAMRVLGFYYGGWISHPALAPWCAFGIPMLYKTLSAAVYGIDANIIEVEVDVSGVKMNEDHFHTVGLPDGPSAKAATGCAQP
jgi:hypothetical protein